MVHCSSLLAWVRGAPVNSGVMPLALVSNPMALLDSEERRKTIEAAFAGREPLDERTFYERYFMNRWIPAHVVARFRRVLEDELNADLSRLRAEDDFERNLSFFWEFDSMADVELIIRLEEEFGIKIKDSEAQQASSVAEMVELVWSKLRPREA